MVMVLDFPGACLSIIVRRVESYCRTTENKMERHVSTRSEKYWTESGRGDGQGDVEKKDHRSYRRPYMMGKARGKVSRIILQSR